MSKGGMGHLEAVISVVIFLIAVFFVITLFIPKNNYIISDRVTKEIFDKIQSNCTVELSSFTFKMNNSQDQILAAGNIITINISESVVNKNISAYINDQQRIESKVEDYNTGIFCVNLSKFNDVVYVQVAESIIPNKIIVGLCPPDNKIFYQQITKDVNKVFSEKKLVELADKCKNKYQLFHDELNLDYGLNLGFSLTSSNNNIKCEKRVPINSEVLSMNTRIKIINMNGSIEFGDLNIKIW